MKTEKVRLADLDMVQSRQLCVRVGLDEETVKAYTACFDRLPPIRVFLVDGAKVVVDGNHRVEAARRLDLPEVDAEVKKGTTDEAAEAAALANVGHGKPLSNAEKRTAVDRMLLLHPGRVNRWIARDVSVAPSTVTGRRHALVTAVQLERLSTLYDEDGNEWPQDLDADVKETDAPKVFPGKVHTLDVLEGLALLEDSSLDLVFTDPPYNIGVSYSGTNQDRMPDQAYHDWCAKWFALLRKKLKDTGSLYVMHYPEVCAEWKRELDRLFTFRRWLTWAYPCNVGQSPTNWTRAQRTVLFYTKGATYSFNEHADPQAFRNPNDKRIKRLREGYVDEETGEVVAPQEGVTPYDWWEFDLVKNVSAEKTEWHNQVPLALVQRVVKVSSNEGDLVCDPFMGSGTTAVAAVTCGREWVGFDQEPKSAAVTAERVAAGQ